MHLRLPIRTETIDISSRFVSFQLSEIMASSSVSFFACFTAE